MNCLDWEERLALYAGGDLAPAQTAEVEHHLAGCAGCQVFASGLREGLEVLRDAHAEVPAPAHFAVVRARVMAEIARSRRPYCRRGWVWAGAAAATLLMAAIAVRPSRRAVPPPPELAAIHPAPPPLLPARVPPAEALAVPAPPAIRRVGRLRPPVAPGEPLLVRLVTDNPDVVIYWISERKRRKLNMRRLFWAAALLALPLMAQPAQDPNERIQKLVTVKYADPASVRSLLRDFGVDAQFDTRMRVIALSGPRNRVTTAEDAIKQLDVPAAAQKDIELTAYFVVASDQPLQGNPIPQDLQSTVATLKSTFPFKSYVLLDALSLQARSGAHAETTGQLSNDRFTTFQVRSASLEADGTMIRLDGLHAGLRILHQASTAKQEFIDTGITTDVVDVKEGQKLVVGRTSLSGPEKALFLILITKVVN